MTKLNRDDVLKLAALARLELTDDEVNKFQKEISEVLNYVDMLQTADVDGLDPTYQVTGLKNVDRADEVIDYGESQTELLKNLPDREGNLIKVKKVL